MVADAQRPIRSTSGAVAPLSACPKPGTTQAVAAGPAAWASVRKCSSGKYSSRSPCTSSSGVGAIRLTTCSGEGGGGQPRLVQPQPQQPGDHRSARGVVSSSQCTRRMAGCRARTSG